MKLKEGDYVRWNHSGRAGLDDRIARVTRIYDSYVSQVYIRFPGDPRTYPVARREVRKVSQRKGAIAEAMAALEVSNGNV